MSESILAVQKLKFKYPDYDNLVSPVLFSRLDFNLEHGDIALILGKPESGKTTLSRILLGLVPRFTGGSIKGDIRIRGSSIHSYEPFNLIEDIGVVFQNPEEQLFTTRCNTEITFALESLGIPKKIMEMKVNQVLKRMQIEPYRLRSPESLSGGEKKKLLLACLMAVDPYIWLLDETLEELDTDSKIEILEFLKSEKKTALILSAKWYDMFGEYISHCYVLTDKSLELIDETPKSVKFKQALVERDIILTDARISEFKSDLKGNTLLTKNQSLPLIQMDNIRFSYAETDPFSLEINHIDVYPGEILSIRGDNGSGKTTLAKLLCGLLVPESGKIQIMLNAEMVNAPPDRLNTFTGYMFQNPDLQIFLPGVREELTYGLKVTDAQVDKTIALFNLPGPDSPPSLMSYGARKRLQAAVYYLLNRPLVILDEGDSGLGVDDFIQIIKLFHSADSTLILITHDISFTELVSDRIIIMEQGRVK